MDRIYYLVCLFLVSDAIRVELEKTYLQLDYRPGGPLEIEEDSLEPKSSMATVDTHQAGWNGTFDNKIALQAGQNEAGAIYVGKLYVSDQYQPVNLIFDTGSDYLTITSTLC